MSRVKAYSVKIAVLMNCTKFLKGGVGCEENEQRKLQKNGQLGNGILTCSPW